MTPAGEFEGGGEVSVTALPQEEAAGRCELNKFQIQQKPLRGRGSAAQLRIAAAQIDLQLTARQRQEINQVDLV